MVTEKAIAVVVGVGNTRDVAARAASRFYTNTGLEACVIDDEHAAVVGLQDARLLKFRIFDLVDAERVLLLDAHMVCLRPWDPGVLLNRPGIVCVRDRGTMEAVDDCREWNVAAEDYFHHGLLVLDRGRDRLWLKLSEDLVRWGKYLRCGDQTAMNVARTILRLPLCFVDRRFNWAGYGEGSLCHRMPVFMAHCVKSEFDAIGDGRQAPSVSPRPNPALILLDEPQTARLRGSVMARHWMSRAAGRMRLRDDGAVIPAGPGGERHWFVCRHDDRTILALASDTEIVHSFVECGNDIWQTVGPGPKQTLQALGSVDATEIVIESDEAERRACAQIVRQRTFRYVRVGYDDRRMELIEGGMIGEGRGACEERWYVDVSGGLTELVLDGRDGVICRLRADDLGIWRGHWLRHEQMAIELSPIEDAALDCPLDADAIRNEYEIRVIAMKRSGHHALMQWIAGHFRDGVHHFNDIIPFSDPILSNRGYQRLEGWLREPKERVDLERVRAVAKQCLILNFEDLDLAGVGNRPLLSQAEAWLGRSRQIHYLLCLRDPYNMLASLYAMERERVLQYHCEILKKWASHAKEFLGQTSYLPGRIIVNHHHWSVSPAYRREISASLSLPFDDRGFRMIPFSVLGGSSFDRLSHREKRPEEMDLRGRWKLFDRDPHFRGFFDAVPEVRELSDAVFGPVVTGW